jgi:hypothetical protein
MAKKTVKKTTKALPSALTVASPISASPATPPARLRQAAAPTAMSLNPVPLAPPVSREQPAAVAQAHLPTAPQTVSAAFVLFEPQASQVCLSGEFNAWSPTATPMARQPEGLWKAVLALRPGRYQYKFVVDGQWLPDPKAPQSVFNEHGSLNSVVEL